jgi:hypothetical protein
MYVARERALRSYDLLDHKIDENITHSRKNFITHLKIHYHKAHSTHMPTHKIIIWLEFQIENSCDLCYMDSWFSNLQKPQI